MHRIAVVFSFFCLFITHFNASADPFPPDVMKWTQDDKEAQRKAGSEILKQIYKATADGLNYVNIPQGVYRFKNTVQPEHPAHILLSRVSDLTIEGNNSWFYFENQASAIKLFACENITIRNLNIDYDPLPYVQGTVISVNDISPRSFIFKPDNNYKMPNNLTNPDIPHSHSTRAIIWRRDNGLIKENQIGIDIPQEADSIEVLPDSTYRIKAWVWWGRSLKDAGVEQGSSLTIFRRTGRAIRLELCGKVTLDNVDIYASGFVAYAGNLGHGPLIFRNCDLKIRPETNRLLSGNADGFNIRGTLKGTLIENCSAEAIGDDCVNIQGVYYKIFKQVSPTELIVANVSPSEGKMPVWHFIAGTAWHDEKRPDNDKLKSWAFLGKRTVLEKKETQFTVPDNFTSQQWAAASNYKVGHSYPALQIRLDQPLEINQNSIFWSEDSIAKGSIIRNNVFHNNFARGIRLQTIDAIVENNRISYTTGPSISLAGQPGYWGESTNCQNIIIRNNIFKDSGRCGGNAAVTMSVEGDPEHTESISNILFEKNTIINPRGSGIELSGVSGITIISNHISGLKSLPLLNDCNPDSPKISSSEYGIPIVIGKGVDNLTIHDNKTIP